MTQLVTNEYGVEFDHIYVKRMRIHRTDNKWKVEYRREPRWFLGLDRWWWFDDGTYVDYASALNRVEELKKNRFVSVPRFQTVKEFDLDD
jgi:hypothetical protein